MNENKDISDEEAKKSFQRYLWRNFLMLLLLTVVITAIWMFVPMHEIAKGISTVAIICILHKPVLLGLKFIWGLLGLTDTSVLKKDKPEKFLG